jgi:hypothetical protein
VDELANALVRQMDRGAYPTERALDEALDRAGHTAVLDDVLTFTPLLHAADRRSSAIRDELESVAARAAREVIRLRFWEIRQARIRPTSAVTPHVQVGKP